MPRVARKNVVTKKGGFFHALNRINCLPGWFPLQNPVISQKFISRLRQSILRSAIHCAGFTLMGNHFHLILFVEEFRKLSRRKLERYARARWGERWKLQTGSWSDERWERFNRDLFDLSVFMRDLQGPFTTWLNLLTGHMGSLWRDRFKCLALGTGGDLIPVQETLLYVELNPVRAKLTSLPEEWKGGSAYLRKMGLEDFLIPIEQIFPHLAKKQVYGYYRALQLHRGINPTKENQASIPLEILRAELKRGFTAGLYARRCRGFIDGLMLGSEADMRRELDRMVLEGVFSRRKNPRPLIGDALFTIREQRSHARS